MSSKTRKNVKRYQKINEADEIISKIIKHFDDQFWNITQPQIVVVAILNKPPSRKNWIARIRQIHGIFKYLVNSSNTQFKECNYVIEIYMDDWTKLNTAQREWVLFHEMLHIVDPKTARFFTHDVQEFSPIYDAVGHGYCNNAELKSLFDKDVKPTGVFLIQRMLTINELNEKDKE